MDPIYTAMRAMCVKILHENGVDPDDDAYRAPIERAIYWYARLGKYENVLRYSTYIPKPGETAPMMGDRGEKVDRWAFVLMLRLAYETALSDILSDGDD